MSFSVGIIGLPNAGKSTLFATLSGISVPIAPFPFSTVDPHRAKIALYDPYLKKVQEVFSSQRATPSFWELVDIAGLVENAHKGEGLGNQFLHHIREADALIHVVRAFSHEEIPHPLGEIDLQRDKEVIEKELLYKDIETVEKSKKKRKPEEKKILEKIEKFLLEGIPARDIPLSSREEKEVLSSLFLLTEKPVLYLINAKKEEFSLPPSFPPERTLIRDLAYEKEIYELPPEEREIFQEGGASLYEEISNRLLSLLDYIVFYTANEKEARAYLVPRGITLYEAAGKVHSDMQKGFIKGEVYSIEEVLKKGKDASYRVYGKDYVLKDRDIIWIQFRI